MLNKLTTLTSTFALVLCALFTSVTCSQTTETKVEWNRFRGPNGSGVHPTSNAPLEWSTEQNLKWKCPLPGYGRSSPIVVGDRVFLTSHSAETFGKQGYEKYLLCIHLQKGKILWQRKINRRESKDRPFKLNGRDSGHAPHTPVSDGKSVFSYFGTDGLWAFDLDGKKLWHLESGTEKHPNNWGTGASPIVHRQFVIINLSLIHI